jgi:hypothetical protein
MSNITVQLDDVVNSYGMVCYRNRNDRYYLTYRILSNSGQTEGNSSFFYQALTQDVSSFNENFADFAWISPPNDTVRDFPIVYLDIDSDALRSIIEYLQTGNVDHFRSQNTEQLVNLIDIATLFGMPELIKQLRELSE